MRSMPSQAPRIGPDVAAQLVELGARVRAHRRRHKVSAVAAAEAAGMSRVTFHRVERGEPSVTMGAYLSAAAAVGLELDLRERQASKADETAAGGVPSKIRLDEYPQLKQLAWQRPAAVELTPVEALNLYERNWRHVDHQRMDGRERALVQALATSLGGGRLLV